MWSFELGPTRSLAIADQLWMARYILHYLSEQFNSVISLDPLKHIQTDNQCMKIWTQEDQSSKQTFAINTDPYNAIKTFSQTIISQKTP